MNKPAAGSLKQVATKNQPVFLLPATGYRQHAGFTLIETMAAISLLTIAIVAPMMLTVQSLSSAYYARDEITAYYLAQEALESVHAIRDDGILQVAESSNGSGINIFSGIPVDQGNFTIDARNDNTALCTNGVCPVLETDGELYGYPGEGDNPSNWTATNFTRTVSATTIASLSGVPQEIRISVTVSWQTGSIARRTFTISEDLYRWIQDGSAAS